MPLLYGEGSAAFLRLQTEIIKISDDESIFAWAEPRKLLTCGLLAQSPTAFKSSLNIYLEPLTTAARFIVDTKLGFPFSMSNRGLQISLYLLHEKRDGTFVPVKSQSPVSVGINVRAPLRCFTTTILGNHIEEHVISVRLNKRIHGYSRSNCGEIYTIRQSGLPTDDIFLHTVFVTPRDSLIRSPGMAQTITLSLEDVHKNGFALTQGPFWTPEVEKVVYFDTRPHAPRITISVTQEWPRVLVLTFLSSAGNGNFALLMSRKLVDVIIHYGIEFLSGPDFSCLNGILQKRKSHFTSPWFRKHGDRAQCVLSSGISVSAAVKNMFEDGRVSFCYRTGIFVLINPMSHVSSAAFAQGQLRAGSTTAQVSLGLLRLAHRIHMLGLKSSTFNEGPEKAPLSLPSDLKYLPCLI